VGLKPFIEASEKYNHILICSNNSKNGPFATNFEVVDRLFKGVFSNFFINEDLIYTAGFSGGSRLATAIAVLTKQIQGVIACGAGFSPNTNHQPFLKEKFDYVGLVGEKDMNYQEMLKVRGWLNKLGMNNELFINRDDHGWPPSKQIAKAFDWLEIQAYKKKIKPQQPNVVASFHQSLYEEARQFEEGNEMELTLWEYQRMNRNFGSFFKMDSIQKKIKAIQSTKRYKKEASRGIEIKKIEDQAKQKYIERFRLELNANKSPKNINWWKKELAKLDKDYSNSTNRHFQDLRYRLIYGIHVMAVEEWNIQLAKKAYSKALYCHRIVSILLPERVFPYFLIAKDYALQNMEDETIEYLKMAISKGLSKKSVITNDIAFYKYKDSKLFQELLDEIKE